MLFLILLLSFGIIYYGIAGLPMMFDKGMGYFIYALFLETLLIVLLVICIIKYRSPKYKEKLNRLKHKSLYKTLSIVAFVFVSLCFIGVSLPTADIENSEKTEEHLNFLNGFTEYGYSTAQIEDMRTVLTNVGITEITELEIGNVVSGMQVVKGVIYKDTAYPYTGKEVQVQFNIENGKIYLVAIYCPSYNTENKPTYLSGLTDRRADLYYDVKGGYLKKIDWEKKAVIDY